MLNKLKNALYTALTVGALAVGSYFLGCRDNPVGPVKENRKPVASLTATLYSGNAPLNETLDASKSADPDRDALKFTYFPYLPKDSTSTIGSNKINVTYSDTGRYKPKVIVEDTKGARDTASVLEDIVVNKAPNQKPIAQFTATPKSGYSPLEVTFASTSYDSDGSIEKRFWDDQDDGVIDDSSNVSITRNYLAPGIYVMSHFVRDNEGAVSDKKLETIVVTEQPMQIAFWSDGDAGSGELYTADLVGDTLLTNKRRLTFNFVNDLSPYFSPDGTKIVFASNRADATGDGYLDTVLWIMNTNGSNPQRLTPDGLIYSSWPFWAQNGKIYFNYADMDSLFHINSQGIAVINPDGKGYKKIIQESFHNVMSGRPSVSPDGSQVVFGTNRDGNPEIYIANSDGTNQQNLTNNPAIDDQPMFSPDGKGVFFTRNTEVYYHDLSSNISRQITFDMGVLDPCVSSDGKLLLFTGQKDGWYFLYSKNLENGNVTRLTFDGIASDGSPIGYRYPATSSR